MALTHSESSQWCRPSGPQAIHSCSTRYKPGTTWRARCLQGWDGASLCSTFMDSLSSRHMHVGPEPLAWKALPSALPTPPSTPLLLLSLCVHAQSLQLCPSLCNPMDCSPPGSSVHAILQARILEWVAISFIGRQVLYH